MDGRKSSYSGANGGQCVEVASAEEIRVRDTSDRDGGTLAFTHDVWQRFVNAIK
jgi:hypothetical protein